MLRGDGNLRHRSDSIPRRQKETRMTKLQRLRQEANLTQAATAEASGLPLRVIQSYEQGHRDVGGIGLRRAIALADALGCRPEDLLED